MDKIFNLDSQSFDGETDPHEFLKSFQIQAAMFNWDCYSETISRLYYNIPAYTGLV
jgi:hypothetical protein